MASNTPKLNLLKKNPATDGNETFNIKTMLNDNWDKIDKTVGDLQEAVQDIHVPNATLDQSGIVQLSNATNGTRENVAATEKAVKMVNDSVTAHLADNTKHVPHLGTTTNTGNAYSINTSENISINQKFTVKINAASTAAATLIISSIGSVKAIKKPGGIDAALKIGVYTLFYDGINFQLLGEGGEYGSAVAADIIAGKTVGTEGGIISGTMPNNGVQSATLSAQGSSKTIPAGYTTGGIVTANITNLVAANIVSPNVVGGITGTAKKSVNVQPLLNDASSYLGNMDSRKAHFYEEPYYYAVTCTAYYVDIAKYTTAYVLVSTERLYTFSPVKTNYTTRVATYINKDTIGLSYDIGYNSYGSTTIVNYKGVVTATSDTTSAMGGDFSFSNGNTCYVSNTRTDIYNINRVIIAYFNYSSTLMFNRGENKFTLNIGNDFYVVVQYYYADTSGGTQQYPLYTFIKVTENAVVEFHNPVPFKTLGIILSSAVY